jgi:hypothetical protein
MNTQREREREREKERERERKSKEKETKMCGSRNKSPVYLESMPESLEPPHQSPPHHRGLEVSI